MFVLLSDILLFVVSLGALLVPKTPLFWFINGILYCFFLLSYTLDATFRCYGLIRKTTRQLSMFANTIIYIGYLIYYLGVRWEINTRLSTLILLVIMPFPFTILAIIFTSIDKIIKSNPIYRNDPKQVHLMKISATTALSVLIVGLPTIILYILAGLLESGLLLEISNFPTPFIKLILSVSNFAINYNKSKVDLEFGMPINSSVFQSLATRK